MINYIDDEQDSKTSPICQKLVDLGNTIDMIEYKIQCRINDIEDKSISFIFKKVIELDNRMKFVEEKINKLNEENILNYSKIKNYPHKCPVCDGEGHTKHIRLNQNVNFCIDTTCISCKGKGVLWR